MNACKGRVSVTTSHTLTNIPLHHHMQRGPFFLHEVKYLRTKQVHILEVGVIVFYCSGCGDERLEVHVSRHGSRCNWNYFTASTFVPLTFFRKQMVALPSVNRSS